MAEGTDANSADHLGTPPAAALALGAAAHDPALAQDVRDYLRRQSELTAIQIQDLKREDRTRHWSLRLASASALMKFAFEIAVAFIVVAFAAVLGSAVWSAAHDDSLVIEAFSVPPDMAARGLTGQAVAAQLQDKLTAMQDATDSARPASSYANNWGDDIKVQIPNTGMSVGEFYGYLASWLGHQTRITGEVYRTRAGIAVTARAGGESGATIVGAEADLDTLLQQAAEKIYQRTQPYRYAIYIVGSDHSRLEMARANLQELADAGSPIDRVWAHVGLASIDETADPVHAPIEERKAAALDPDFALAYEDLAADEGILDHDEASLAAERMAVILLQKDNGGQSARARTIGLASNQADLAAALYDFTGAIGYAQAATQLPDYTGMVEGSREAIVIDLAMRHENSAARQALHDLPPVAVQPAPFARSLTALDEAYWSQDWPALLAAYPAAQKNLENITSVPGFTGKYVNVVQTRQIWPFVAVALAMTGDLKGAHAMIDRTPADCFICMRNRGEIATAGKNWGAAQFWFARAVGQAPSIPLGYYAWGAMLLRKGDPDGAIAKFTLANQKGPHFADPLEMWGEALMAKSRADLALTKFAEANKYAPNWGRLHLKWGQALFYAGRKDEAKAQFVTASGLDLSAADKAELARAAHG
jgi:tetratricopeptide (TPR) repeat protein